MRTLAAGVLAAFALFAVAEDDGDGKAGPDMRPSVYIDARAIENKTDNPSANFKGLIDRLDSGLTECGVYRVLNSGAMTAGCVDDEVFTVLGDDGGKESKIETPAYKLYATIVQYGDARLSGIVSSSRRQAKIELFLKIVDMRSKETLKSKTITRTATGSAVGDANLAEQVLQEANKKVVKDIIAELVGITSFSVLDVEDGEVVVDIPSSLVKVGQQLSVYKKGNRVKSKRTGKITARESQVAVLRVATLSEDSVTCQFVSGKIEPKEGASAEEEYRQYVVRAPAPVSKSQKLKPQVLELSKIKITQKSLASVAKKWFDLSDQAESEELQQLILKTAAAALICCGKSEQYQSTVRKRIMEVSDFEGSLYVSCPACQGGNGDQPKCSECGGNGICHYANCQEGKHRVMGFAEYGGDRYENCKRCRGTGVCQKCQGSGFQSGACRKCHGKGGYFKASEAFQVYQHNVKTILENLDEWTE